jgi:hypothetical protein
MLRRLATQETQKIHSEKLAFSLWDENSWFFTLQRTGAGGKMPLRLHPL